MHALELAANLPGWRIFVRRKADKAFRPVETRVFNRDAYTCQYCGFQADAYQEVVNLDGNYNNNKLANLITACCFCSQCLFLQTAGVDDKSGGQLIYLPELSQADLNSFCHVLFCAMGNSTGYQDTAQSIYRTLKFRSQIIEKQLGTGMSQPHLFGQTVIESQHRYPDKTISILPGLRLLPAYAKFTAQLDIWAKAALAELEGSAVTPS